MDWNRPVDDSVCRLYWAAALLAAITLPMLMLDVPVARWPTEDLVPGDLRRILGWAEVFAHGYGVALIGLTAFVLDVAQRRKLPRLLASAYVAGILANLVKLAVARVRPRYFDLIEGGGVVDTFIGFVPWLFGSDPRYHSGFEIQSFPSGHTATAVGFAIGLTRIYPRGGWLFFTFAALAAWQRIDVQAHYVSDTVAAASLGFLGAALVTDRRGMGRWFDAWERRPAAGQKPPRCSSAPLHPVAGIGVLPSSPLPTASTEQ